MRDTQAPNPKGHFPQIPDAVERGETARITCHGQTIARTAPEVDHPHHTVDQAIDSIESLRHRTGKITIQDLLTARHEGHQY